VVQAEEHVVATTLAEQPTSAEDSRANEAEPAVEVVRPANEQKASATDASILKESNSSTSAEKDGKVVEEVDLIVADTKSDPESPKEEGRE
jgi:hypothetical protein